MRLSPGARLGSYQVIGFLGAGGVGEVWRARDLRLGRDVAVKVLFESFSRDPVRVARFEREARLLASLNHPNIAAIYGFEQADGVPFLVLELVDGPTLAERIAEGAFSPEQTIALALQVVDALEEAHEKGIVHRDLKPGNIKAPLDGKVKVLDFGLAKALDVEPQDRTQSTTAVPLNVTAEGSVHGTAAYMSPEQARGLPVDRRTDNWAFGCTLYEMLTRRPAFGGETTSHIIVSVLEQNPDWKALPASTPRRLRELIERCLQKDSALRVQHIGDARLDLLAARGADTAANGRPRVWPWTAWAVTAVAAATLGVIALRRPEPPPPEVVRFLVPPPDKGHYHQTAISPDGRRMAIVVHDQALKEYVLLRSVDSPKLTPLKGSEGALRPFWSPDGRYLAFFTRDGKLKKIDVAGGLPPVMLCDAPAAGSGGAWNRESVILFASNGKLHRVSASGGKPDRLPSPDSERRRYPQFLPDGRRFLYFAGQPGATAMYVGSLDSRDGIRIVDSSDPGLFVSPDGSRRGYLLFSRGETIMAQPFDPDAGRLSGESIPVAERLYVGTGLSYAGFSAAGGVLAHRSASAEGGQIVWLDRDGNVVEAIGPRGVFGDPHLSPDNLRIAFTATEARANPDVWVHDLVRGVRERFTVNAAPDEAPVWSPDGKAIVFASRREEHQILIQDVAGAGGERILLSGDESRRPTGRPTAVSFCTCT